MLKPALVVLGVLVASCGSDDTTPRKPSGDSTPVITAQTTSFPDISAISDMALLGDSIAVLLDRSAPFVKVVRVIDGATLDSFATFGVGPGELRDPHELSVDADPTGNSWILLVHEPNQRGVSRWRLADSATFLGRLTTTGPRVAAVVALGDTLIGSVMGYAPAPIERARGVEFGSGERFGTVPYAEKELKPSILFDANWHELVADRRSGMVAVAYFYAPEIQFLSADGTRAMRWRDSMPWSPPVPSLPPNAGFSVDSSMIGFLRAGASPAGVVGAFCGCRGATRGQTPLTLLVFDWAGALRARVEVPPGVRAVDLSDDGRFALVAYDDPEARLVRVPLPTP
jgi:hypothetical protein